MGCSSQGDLLVGGGFMSASSLLSNFIFSWRTRVASTNGHCWDEPAASRRPTGEGERSEEEKPWVQSMRSTVL